jgi:uncharacterized protein YbcI
MESETALGGEPTDEAGSLARTISRGMVGLYKDYLGRGPIQAKTWLKDDMVVTILHDSLTKAEQKLEETDRSGTVRSIRREFQDAMRDDLITLVEEQTGRSALCLLSDHSPSPDYAVELVLLAPREAAA